MHVRILGITLRTCATNSWYFDSGCSRHMTGNQEILTSYRIFIKQLVTKNIISHSNQQEIDFLVAQSNLHQSS